MQIELIVSTLCLHKIFYTLYLYKITLRQGKLSEKGGAGLGLIDIARESLDKINYKFYPADDKKSFFLMSVAIR